MDTTRNTQSNTGIEAIDVAIPPVMTLTAFWEAHHTGGDNETQQQQEEAPPQEDALA